MIVACEEFMRVMYRIELSTWPEISPEQLSQVAGSKQQAPTKYYYYYYYYYY